MMGAARDGLFDVLVVEALDRLSRDQRLSGNVSAARPAPRQMARSLKTRSR